MLQEAIKGNVDVNNIISSKVLTMTPQKLNKNLPIFTSNYTAKLWIQYLHLNDLLRQHLRAQKLGNWELYLDALYKMLAYFAAWGHNKYTKSLWLYLQQMNNLEHKIVRRYIRLQSRLSCCL